MEAQMHGEIHFCDECRYFIKRRAVDSYMCGYCSKSINWYSRACTNAFEVFIETEDNEEYDYEED